MARIRTIKPDFWTDGNMIGLSAEARLFYIGTWNFTLCDRGHLPDDPMGLKLKVLPADDVDPVALLAELIDKGRIVRITTSDERTFLLIPRFEDHQKIDARWNSRCPACALSTSPNLTETHASLGETHEEIANRSATRLGGEGKGRERKGGEGNPTPFCETHPNGTDKPCRACGNARLAFDAAKTAEKNKPTPGPHDCKKDGHRPHPHDPAHCLACGEPVEAVA